MGAENQIFISYAHEDVEWKDEFVRMLSPAVRRGSISLWSDENIPAGQDWAQSIDQALRSASVGLLLVTPHFLNSSFINNEELARLLNLAKTAGVAICWVPVSASLYTETPLKPIQAAWDVSRPLDQMPPAQRGDAVYKICTEIVEKYGFLPRVTGRRRETLPRELQSRLADRYEVGGEIGAGQFSIVYRAQQKNPSRTVAVKLFVASEFDECANQTFKDAVKRGAELTSPAFVRIIEHSMDATPEFLVTEFVHGEPLPKYLLRYPQGLPLTRVRSILLDLASSLEEIHFKGWLRGEICASNILVDQTGKARLSTVDLSTVLSEQSLGAGTFNINRESLAYMTPERFFGRPHTQATDQFSLGLIATELIGGEQMPRVNSPSDLELKRQVFRDLETGKGRWGSRSPELAGIVARMLRTHPDGRWPSMTDVRHFLRDVDIAESEEDRNRSDQYAANASRDQLMAESRDLTSFLRSLDMSISFSDSDTSGWQRFTQLINKSNQFNLTTKRYSDAQVQSLIVDPSVLLLQVRLVDRFGDNGMISAIIGRNLASEFVIDTWVMSCRVLNRQVEQAVLNEIDTAAEDRCREPGEVADDAAAEGNHEIVALDLRGNQRFADLLKAGIALRAFAILDNDRCRGDACSHQ